jgi:hypothetical protein
VTANPAFDPGNAELCEFEQVSPNWKTRVRLPEGAVLELEVSVGQVFRVGNEPNTGFPVYNVATNTLVRLISVEPKLRKKALRPPVAADSRGFA